MSRDDQPAKLYVTFGGEHYRIKVFEEAVWVERLQPIHGGNLLMDQKADDILDDADSWLWENVESLIIDYEMALIALGLGDEHE